MTNIRVAFICRPNINTDPGGDTTQLKQTALALEKLGVHVQVITAGNTFRYEDFDLLHFFNITDSEDLLRYAMESPIPYVVSTIYLNYREYDRYHRNDIVGLLSRVLSNDTIEYLKTTAKYLLKGERVSTPLYFLKGHRGSMVYVLKKAALLLPNSENEYRRLERDYGISKPYLVVPNAINPEMVQPHQPVERDLVLCVGRIEGRKNHLNLIRAMKGLDKELWLVGKPADHQPAYYKQCRDEAGDNVRFLNRIPDQELIACFQRARVHALPSWFETTGLVSLEAAAMGCNIVVGDRGDVRDYFHDFAFYCEPGDVASIRKAIEEAFAAPVDPQLKQLVLTHYTWQKTAEATLAGYKRVLQKK